MDGNNFIELDYSLVNLNINSMSNACNGIVLSELSLESNSNSLAMDALVASYSTLKTEIDVYRKILASDINNVSLACNTLKGVDDTANLNIYSGLGLTTPTSAGAVNMPQYSTNSTPPFSTTPPYATTP